MMILSQYLPNFKTFCSFFTVHRKRNSHLTQIFTYTTVWKCGYCHFVVTQLNYQLLTKDLSDTHMQKLMKPRLCNHYSIWNLTLYVDRMWKSSEHNMSDVWKCVFCGCMSAHVCVFCICLDQFSLWVEATKSSVVMHSSSQCVVSRKSWRE